MSEGKHTPLPWSVGDHRRAIVKDVPGMWMADGYDSYNIAVLSSHSLLGLEEAYANAELIVRAVNSHQMLVDALRKCSAVLAGDHMTKQALIDALEAARMALASAAPPVESKSEVVG